MTTIINTPSNPVSRESADSGAGWFVAIVILLAVIGVGAFIWFYYYQTPAQPSGTTNINVTLPIPTADDTSGTP